MSFSSNEVGPHDFWLHTCNVDTHSRGVGYAQLDTPWNAFTPAGILVCTLWVDRILTVFDEKEDRLRQFIKIGGKARTWRGPAVQHGKQAKENLAMAARGKKRVVGYEAEPNNSSGRRQIKHFYLDRRHELQRIFDFSSGEMLERLKINERFEEQQTALGEVWLEPGDIFELVEPKGEFPGISSVPQADDASTVDADDDGSENNNAEPGNLSNEEYALACIPLLIEHVMNQKDDTLRTLTYEDLAELLGRRNKHGAPAPRGLGKVLGRAMELIEAATREWEIPVPYLTTIVVEKTGPDKGLPGVGVRERWQGYESMNRTEKQSKMLVEHLKILNYGSRWNDVLQALELPTIHSLPSDGNNQVRGGGWGGGESEAHKALKAFVKANPEMFGASESSEAFDEYALRSGDQIDVFFKSSKFWVGVEVKSSVSENNELDLERGIYQVVKYRSVLEAQARIDYPNERPTVSVILALECKLGAKLAEVAASLGVKCILVSEYRQN